MFQQNSAPFPVTYRELWLPGHIRGSQLPSSARGGSALTVTGGTKRTTADGVRFVRGANSHIDLGAIHNSAARLWISLRIKPAETLTPSLAANRVIWMKRMDGSNFLQLYWEAGNGTLRLLKYDAGAQTFNISAGGTTWNAGTWYHLLFSISNVNGVRLRVDNGTPATNADLSAAPASGNIIIGDQTAGGGMGISGIITDIVIGADDLTIDEEADLYKGVPPLDAVNLYTCDEGRGTTINDRGSGGNNGVLGSAATWAFGSCRRPVLSLDGLNDRATSGLAPIQNLAGGQTVVWVARAKSTYSGISRTINSWQIGDIGGGDFLELTHSTGVLRAIIVTGGATGSKSISLNHSITIDEYLILIETYLGSTGDFRLYSRGYLVGSATQTGMRPLATQVWLGMDPSGTQFDVSKTLMFGVIDGVLPPRQVKDYSRWLNDTLGLGVTI